MGGEDSFFVKFPTTMIGSNTLASIKNWIKNNNLTVKYKMEIPQKIVLPKGVQIKLNSFANKTHIFVESGEVDATVKATVSKSLGATVQSNSNEINILNGRVADIEGLKESQDFSYELPNNRNYLECKETKNGTVKDLKVYGRTLLQLVPKFEINYTATSDYDGYNAIGQSNAESNIANRGYVLQDLKPNTEYTLIYNVVSCGTEGKFAINNANVNTVFETSITINYSERGVFAKKLKTRATFDEVIKVALRCQNANSRGLVHIKDIMILEGDWTQNPPSYFEGIASVGTGVDEIEVSTANKNLVEDAIFPQGIQYNTCCKVKGNIKPNSTYVISIIVPNGEKFVTETSTFTKRQAITGNGTMQSVTVTTKDKLSIDSKGYINIFFNETGYTSSGNAKNIMIENGDIATDYVEHKGDKKAILFKDVDDTWKPVTELREWDTIEEHGDSKQYYHNRSGNGIINSTSAIEDTGGTSLCYRIKVKFNDIKPNDSKLICATFANVDGFYEDTIGIKVGSADNYVYVQDLKSKYTSYEDFKSKVNLTFVYQLNTEQVFEVNPLFLESYETETMISFRSGVIAPCASWKITSYLPNFVMNLAKQLKQLQEQVYKTNVANFTVALNTLETKLRLEQLTKTPR